MFFSEACGASLQKNYTSVCNSRILCKFAPSKKKCISSLTSATHCIRLQYSPKRASCWKYTNIGK